MMMKTGPVTKSKHKTIGLLDHLSFEHNCGILLIFIERKRDRDREICLRLKNLFSVYLFGFVFYISYFVLISFVPYPLSLILDPHSIASSSHRLFGVLFFFSCCCCCCCDYIHLNLCLINT